MMHTKILTICGSVRPDSRTAGVLAVVQERLRRANVENQIWPLGTKPLPIMDANTRGNFNTITDPLLRTFLADAASCDGIILGTPVYHDSYSGVLKNALDHLSSEVLRQKPFGLSSHGGRRTTSAVAHLSIVVRAVGGIPLSTQLCTEDDDLLFDDAGYVAGIRVSAITTRIDQFCAEMAQWAAILRALREQPVSALAIAEPLQAVAQ